jgi:hypothetical protein
MPKFVVTPDDREWFGRCRRAWDLGARARRGLVPRAAPLEPDGSLVVALRAALAVHYFPGMWAWDRTIVEPLVRAAYDETVARYGRALLEGFLRWAATADEGTPLRVEADIDVHVPDPVLPDTHLASTAGDAVRYRDRIDLVLVDDDDRCWLAEHRVVRQFADDDELRLDERAARAGPGRRSSWPRRSPASSTRSAHRPTGVPAAVGPAVGRREGRGAPVGESSWR